MDLTINGHRYQSEPMPVDAQFHVARKMAPAFWAYMAAMMEAGAAADRAALEAVATPLASMPSTVEEAQRIVAAANENKDVALKAEKAAFSAMISSAKPLMDVVSSMSTEDADFVKNSCLVLWSRQPETGQGWQKIYVKGAGFVFNDINLPVMMQLIVATLRENLADFIAVLETLK